MLFVRLYCGFELLVENLGFGCCGERIWRAIALVLLLAVETPQPLLAVMVFASGQGE